MSIKYKKINGKYYLYQIDNILSPSECIKLIKQSNNISNDKLGNRSWHIPQNNRGTYQRAILVDTKLAKKLFNRIKKIIPKSLVEENHEIYLNNWFRFSKYNMNGEFPIHRDGKNYDVNGGESFCTLNIFLNEDFYGGSTIFYEEDKNNNIYERFKILPKTGRGGFFFAEQLHSGEKVIQKSETKYLLRTDLMIKEKK